MIKFKRLGKDNHILISADEPMRAEILVMKSGQLVVYAYKGTEIQKDQDPETFFFNWSAGSRGHVKNRRKK